HDDRRGEFAAPTGIFPPTKRAQRAKDAPRAMHHEVPGTERARSLEGRWIFVPAGDEEAGKTAVYKSVHEDFSCRRSAGRGKKTRPGP
ncbi:MAG: hypothetical protein ACNS61_05950, partial [Candidatus Wenzhouxiangella sp. M2_3B_020]